MCLVENFRLNSLTPISNLAHTIWLCTFATVAALWNDRHVLILAAEIAAPWLFWKHKHWVHILIFWIFALLLRNIEPQSKNNLIKSGCGAGREVVATVSNKTCRMKLLHNETSDWNELIHTWVKCVPIKQPPSIFCVRCYFFYAEIMYNQHIEALTRIVRKKEWTQTAIMAARSRH